MAKKMKLLLSKPRGFCAGVERAIETVEKSLELWGAPIYVKHEIVHNKYVVDGLKNKGAIFIEDLKDIIDALIARYPHIATLPSTSICYATTNREMAVREITDQTDLVLVVGDPQSSNSNMLREAASKRGIASFLINDQHEIDPA